MIRFEKVCVAVLALSLCMAAPSVGAAITEFRVLIDADNDVATGCSVSTMAGVDHVLVTRVETDDKSGTITRTYRSACEAGVPGPELELGHGWDAGFQPASGQLLVETSMPFDAFGPALPSTMRVGVEAQQGSAIHRALAQPDGSPVLFPTPRRRRAAGTAGEPRVIVPNGSVDDWLGLGTLFEGIASGGTGSLRMLKVFAFADVARDLLFFRIDANISTDAPFASDDEYARTQGDAALTVAAPGVLANDGDPNGLPLTALPVGSATHGTITLNPDGSFTYTPNDPTSAHPDVFEYRATNGTKESNAAQVRIAVSNVFATAPEAADDAWGTNEDESLVIAPPGVLANDSDPNGDLLMAALLAPPSHGTVTLDAGGGFTYAPADHYFGIDTFTYSVSDGSESDTATVTITIASVNDPPRLRAATFAVAENSAAGTLVGTVLVRDADTTDEHTFSIVSGNSGGTFAIDDAGRITVLDPAALDFETTQQFILTVRARDDGEPELSDTATITVTVTDANEAPVAVADAFETDEDTLLSVPLPGVLGNDSDVDGDPLTAILVIPPANGALALNADGSFSYTPAADFNGSDSFTYRVSDGALESVDAIVSLTIHAVNDAPVFAAGGDVATDEDVAFGAVWATAISAGPADEAGQALTFAVTANSNPALFAIAPALGSDGVLSFTPAPDANGSASITVTLSDDGGGTNTSAPVTFTITVNAVNDTPSFTGGGDVTVSEDSGAYSAAWASVISSGPADEAGQALIFTVTTNSNPGLFAVAPSISSTGVLSFTPAADANGVANITVTLADDGGGADTSAPVTFAITVDPVNDAPSFTGGGDVATDEDVAFSAPWATAISAGAANETAQVLSFSVTVNSNPALFAAGPVIDPAGVLSFTPAQDASGTASITVVLTDDGGGTDTSAPVTFTITVNAVNDAPVQIVPSGITTPEETTVAVPGISVSDIDAMAGSVETTLTATDGTLTLGDTSGLVFSIGDGAADTTMTFQGPIATVNARLATLSYTPNADFDGTETITVSTSDQGNTPAPAQSDTDALTILVTPVNDAPVNHLPAAQTAGEDVALVFTGANAITISDVDAGTGHLVTAVTSTNGVITAQPGAAISGNGSNAVFLTGTVSEINASLDGLIFTPAPEFAGVATVALNTNDQGNTGSGGAQVDAGDVVTITVVNANDAPVNAVPTGVSVLEDSLANPLAGVSVSDVDAGAMTRITLAVTNGTLSLGNTTGLAFLAGDGTDDATMTFEAELETLLGRLPTLTFTPAPDFFGTATVTVTSDDLAVPTPGTDSDTFDIAVESVNDAPVNTLPAPQATDEDVAVVFTGANAITISDVDAGAGELVTAVTSTNGILTAQPGAAISGNGSSAVYLTGTVSAINASLDGMVFTPTPEFTGVATVALNTNDQGNSGSGGAQSDAGDVLTITVLNANDPPVNALPTGVSVLEDSIANPVAGLSVSDIDAGATMRMTLAVTNGTLSLGNITGLVFLTGDGTDDATMTVEGELETLLSRLATLTFTPTPDFFGAATVTVTSDDLAFPTSGTDIDTFDITVTNVNDEPSFTKGADISVLEDSGAFTQAGWATALNAGPNEGAQALSFNVSNDNIALFSVQPAVDATGQLTFTPVADMNGSATVTLSISDDGGVDNGAGDTSADQTFVITVTAVNDAPSFTKGADVTVLEDSGAFTEAAWATAISTGPSDESGQTVTLTVANDNNGLFSVQPAVDGTGQLTFTTAADAFGSAAVTLSVSDNGGTANGGVDTSASETFTITIDPVNDPPVITSGNVFSIPENTTAVVTVTTTDTESDTITYTLTGGADQGDFSIDLNTGALTFDPAPNFESPADGDTNNVYAVEVTATDGSDPVTQTITVTVANVDEQPVFTSSATPSLLENTTAVVTVQASDPESVAVTYSITGGVDMALFTIDTNTGALSFLSAPDFEAPADAGANNVYDVQVTATEGTMPAVQSIAVSVLNGPEPPVFTSTATPSAPENQTAVLTVTTTDDDLDVVTYSLSGGADQTLFTIDANTGALSFLAAPDFETPADNGADNVYDVQVEAVDGTFTVQQTITVTVTNVDEAPSITSGDTVTLGENTIVATTVTATDPDTASLTFSVSGGADQGDFSIDANSGVLSFAPAPDFENPADADANNVYVVEVSVTDGTSSVSQTITVTVTDLNEGPQITTPGAVSYDENGTGIVLTVVANDPEGDGVTYAFTGGSDTSDLAIGVNSGAITFNAPPDFEAPADSDTNNTYVVEVTATSIGGSDVQTITITVANVNEPPVITSGAPGSVAENSASPVHTVTATDPDGTSPGFSISGGADAADFSINASNGQLSFVATPNFEAPADTDTNNVYEVIVRASSDGLLFDDETYLITVTDVNEAPTAVTDSYNAVGGTLVHLAGGVTLPGAQVATTGDVRSSPRVTGVKGNDSDPDINPAFNTLTVTVVTGNAGAVAVPVGGQVTTTTTNGSVTMHADGSFHYTPNAGYLGADSFTYTISDGLFNATGSVGVTVHAPAIRYVKNDAATAGNGTSVSPHQTLAAAIAASSAGELIYVMEGDGTATRHGGSNVMKANQKLWGQGVALSVTANSVALNLISATNHPLIGPDAGANPTISITNVSGVDVRGLSINGGTTNAIDLTTTGASAGGFSAMNNIISAAGQEGIDVNHGSSAAVTVNLQSNTITSIGTGFDFVRTSTGINNQIVFSGNNIMSNGSGVNISGGSVAATTTTGFANNSIHGNTAGAGVTVSNVTFDSVPGGGINQVDGDALSVGVLGNPVGGAGLAITGSQGSVFFDDLDVYSASGTALTLTETGSGLTFEVLAAGGGGTSSIDADAGPAVDINGIDLDLRLADLDSTTSTNGVTLTGIVGDFSVASAGSISKTSGGGTGFSVSNSNATIDYAGTLNVTSGNGVSLATNTGSTITFRGGMTLSTGTNAAFAATGGGTVNVCDESACNASSTGSLVNTLTTTSGTALNVANTTIGASALEFRSISSNGAASGIILNNTGSTAGLIVKGTGSAGSGGTIQNSTGDAISLTSTQSPSFTSINVTNTNGHGINAATLTAGFTLQSSAISNTGNGDNDHAVKMLDVSGTVSVQNTSFTNTAEDFFNIDSATNNATLTLNVGTVTGCTFTQPNAVASIRGGGTFAGNGILVAQRGSKNYTVNVSNSTFTDIKLTGIQVGSSATSTAANVNVNLDNNDFLVTITNSLGNPNNRANAINIQSLNVLDIDASITNNLLDGGGGGAIQLGADNSSSIHANITGNQMIDQFADGILIGVDENASLTVLIDNNTITNTSSDGMELANFGTGGSSTLNATITNNTVSGHNNNLGGNAFAGGIFVQGGDSSGDNTFIDIRSNNVSGNLSPFIGATHDYSLQNFGDPIVVEGAGVAVVDEAQLLGLLGNIAGPPAGDSTFLYTDTVYSNGVTVPLPTLTP